MMTVNAEVCEDFRGWSVEETEDGRSGERVFIVPWTNAFRFVPQIGEPHPEFPDMRVYRRERVGFAKPGGTGGTDDKYTQAKITVYYRTPSLSQLTPDWLDESWSISGEAMQCMEGRVWQGLSSQTGIDYYCDVNQTAFFPVMEYSRGITEYAVKDGLYLSLVNKVNYRPFLPFPPETCLFLGIQSRREYDNYGNPKFRTYMQFQYRPMGHNLVWRPPVQERDENGAPVYDANYQPVYVAGPAGIGGWDRPNPPLFLAADFSPLLR